MRLCFDLFSARFYSDYVTFRAKRYIKIKNFVSVYITYSENMIVSSEEYNLGAPIKKKKEEEK